MRQLLLLRHAKSSWDDPRLPDHARPLNARGRQAAAAIRDAMRRLDLLPELVLVSSARRALQTLEALQPWDKPPRIEPQDALYLAAPDALLGVLQAQDDAVGRVLLIGHNPGLHELSLQLAGDTPERSQLAPEYPTGALAEFQVPGPWRTLQSGSRLVRFITPRDLPQIAA